MDLVGEDGGEEGVMLVEGGSQHRTGGQESEEEQSCLPNLL